jgi:O-antigen/teichoic acid export membrane protein
MKKFLFAAQNIEKSSYIWNMAGGLLLAIQSVIMLVILAHTAGLADAGIFTIAYASAILMLAVGKYGVRNFQVSDTIPRFSFAEYRNSRVATSSAMMVFSVALVAFLAYFNHYSANKAAVIVIMCVFKLADSMEDVYHGYYQQRGRLDVAAKALTVRLCAATASFGILLALTRNLLLSLAIATAITWGIFAWLAHLTVHDFYSAEAKRCSKQNILELIKSCTPLFLGSFLSLLVINAPKYAIDSLLNDEFQAHFGFISMPAFVIGLLNSFIYNPTIRKMSLLWNEGSYRDFKRLIFRQIVYIAVISIACVGIGWLIGIPVLSMFYNTPLEGYRTELLVILVGGGFLALSGFLLVAVTIVRFQKSVAFVYLGGVVFAFVLSPYLVTKHAIMGASIAYLVSMAVVSAAFLFLFIGFVRRSTA